MATRITKELLKELYLPPTERFVLVDVPRLPFLAIDGEGDPRAPENAHALRWLFAVAHPIKREARRRMGKHFVEPPLEGLFDADDPADLAAGRKDRLQWSMRIPAPDWATPAIFADAVAEASRRLGDPPPTLRLMEHEEGRCAQIQHVGDVEAERATLARLHDEWLPANDLVAHGPHHEIYLNDPNRTAPEDRRTVLRQPVCPCGGATR